MALGTPRIISYVAARKTRTTRLCLSTRGRHLQSRVREFPVPAGNLHDCHADIQLASPAITAQPVEKRLERPTRKTPAYRRA